MELGILVKLDLRVWNEVDLVDIVGIVWSFSGCEFSDRI